MGSRMIYSCVKLITSDSHSEDWGSNPHGGAKYKIGVSLLKTKGYSKTSVLFVLWSFMMIHDVLRRL